MCGEDGLFRRCYPVRSFRPIHQSKIIIITMRRRPTLFVYTSLLYHCLSFLLFFLFLLVVLLLRFGGLGSGVCFGLAVHL